MSATIEAGLQLLGGDDWAAKYDAPEGQVWVCGACGKTASNKANGGRSYGWDESCFMWAVLCYDEHGAGTEEKPWRAVEEAEEL